MTFTVYYSNTMDLVPPSIWRVDAFQWETSNQVLVEATDLSDVVRVGVAYTLRDGVWDTTDLTRSASNPNVWIGAIPDEETIEWFVQALDGAGNVAINDNKGAYLDTPANRVLSQRIPGEKSNTLIRPRSCRALRSAFISLKLGLTKMRKVRACCVIMSTSWSHSLLHHLVPD
jgi:hypothetical protein